MKKPFLLFFFGIFSLFGSLLAQDMNSDIDKVLISWLEKIPPGSEIQYGFGNREEFFSATSGKSIAVYMLSPAFFSGPVKPDSNYLIPAGEWRVPVMVNKSSRALLTVVQGNQGWQIVDMGATTLARELEDMSQEQGIDALPVTIIRVYQLQCDFITSGDPAMASSSLVLHPLHSAFLNLPKLYQFGKNSIILKDLYQLINDSYSNGQ